MGNKKKKKLADKADKYKCYQKAVQSPEHEIDFFEQAYGDICGGTPQSLREDFCGTFAICCHWVQSGEDRTAVAVDLDDEPLQWGRDKNLSKLSEEEQERIRILQQDVRTRNRPQVDILAAQNFSFWIFKTREEVIDYFKIARANLRSPGIMIMDMMGGGGCYEENHTDKRTIKKGKKGFKYYWKQVRHNPITGDSTFEISFKFADGSWMRNAFAYHWRFWTIPEVRELVREAGFRDSHVYWEREDESDWQIATEAESDPSWIAYVVAEK